ncbi:hypothetical protein Tco_0923373 [Tanacetum coccineum]|uniref:Uncharacterized protein n=1 Tax=Tanacetum coccineum TaxID=301880 RepID=A0ABQ5D783_9ASTR
MAVRTQPTLSPGMSARIAEATALSPSSFCKRYRSSYETPSPSSSPTLYIWKRYRGTSKLVEDTKDESSDSDTEREGSEDEGPGLEDDGPGLEEEEEAADKEGSVPSTFEIEQSSRSMSEQQRVEETPTPRPQVRATWVDPMDGIVYTDIPVNVPPVRVLVWICYKRDKNKAKQTKPSTGMERARKTEAEDIFIFNGLTRTYFIGPDAVNNQGLGFEASRTLLLLDPTLGTINRGGLTQRRYLAYSFV